MMVYCGTLVQVMAQFALLRTLGLTELKNRQIKNSSLKQVIVR